MPDGTTAIDPNAASPAAKALSGPTNPLAAAQANYDKVSDQATQEEAQHQRQHVDELKREDMLIDGLKQPQLNTVPPPTPRTTDPQKAWGSMAMIMAAFGSLLTRTPLTTAMNSAASAIKAFRQGDQEAFDAAYKSWQVANENATKLWEFQQKTYENILGHVERERHIADEELVAENRETNAKVATAAHALNDQRMLAELQQNGILGARRLQIERQRAGEAYNLNAGKLAEQAEFFKAWHTYQTGPDFKPKPGETPEQTQERHLDKLAELQSTVMPSHQWTPSEKAGAEDRQQTHLANSLLGKAYSTAAQKIDVINQYDGSEHGVISQAAFIDAYTQLINGGRAIRGFQQKLNTEHAGLFDKAAIMAQQLGRGGPLSPRMIEEAKEDARAIGAAMSTEYGQAISAAQKRAKAMGLDPDAVVPDDYQPERLGGGASGGFLKNAPDASHVADGTPLYPKGKKNVAPPVAYAKGGQWISPAQWAADGGQ